MSETFRAILAAPLFTPLGYFPKTTNRKTPSVLPEAVRQYLPKSTIVLEDVPSPARVFPEKEEPEPQTMAEFANRGRGKSQKDIFAAKE